MKLLNRKELILLLFLLTTYTFFIQNSGAEQRSFLALTLSLHNEHSLIIDPYAEMTPDKAFYDGHYYSDKAPGLSLLSLPVYAVFNAMQDLGRPGLLLPYIIYLINCVVIALPSALLALLILRFLLRLGIRELHAYATTVTMALGTLAFPFATLFFSHGLSAFLVFGSFYTLYLAKTLEHGGNRRPARLLLAGILSGAAVVCEFPMAIMALLLLIYALSFLTERKQALYYILGGVPLALLLFAYNSAAFGSPLRFSYFYEANTWAQVHQQGFLGLGVPNPNTLITVLFGPRGLFTLSPVLLLALYGFVVMLRQASLRARGGALPRRLCHLSADDSGLQGAADRHLDSRAALPGAHSTLPGGAPGLQPAPAVVAVPAAGRHQHRHHAGRHFRQPAGGAGRDQPVAHLLAARLLQAQRPGALAARDSLWRQPHAGHAHAGRRLAGGRPGGAVRVAAAPRATAPVAGAGPVCRRHDCALPDRVVPHRPAPALRRAAVAAGIGALAAPTRVGRAEPTPLHRVSCPAMQEEPVRR